MARVLLSAAHVLFLRHLGLFIPINEALHTILPIETAKTKLVATDNTADSKLCAIWCVSYLILLYTSRGTNNFLLLLPLLMLLVLPLALLRQRLLTSAAAVTPSTISMSLQLHVK